MKRTIAAPRALLAVAITLGGSACNDDSPTASETTGGSTTEASETTEAPGTTEADSDTEAGGNSTVEAPEPGDEPTVESATPVLVGLTEEEAVAAAEDLGWELRVIRRDGEDLPITMDLRPNRVNVEVTDDEVTGVLQIG